MTDITWGNSTKKLSELIPSWEQNPKKLTPETAEHMKVSLSKFGLAIPLLISPDRGLFFENASARQEFLTLVRM